MSATIRQVENAVGLIISGALRAAEYGPGVTEEQYRIQVLLAVTREVGDWLESDDLETVKRVASNITFRLDQGA